MKEETTYAHKGNKIKIEKCPHCKSRLVVNMEKDKTEVLVCENCKFKVGKK